MILVAALLVVLAVGLWSYRSVQESVRELRANSLSALVAAEVEALDVWIGELKQDALRIAADPAIRREALALVAVARAHDEAAAARLRTARARRALLDALPATEGSRAGVHLIDRDGLILATRTDAYLGHRIAPAMRASLQPVFRGRAVFLHPHQDRDRLLALDAAAEDGVHFWVEAPVHGDAGLVVAALGIGYRADREFAALFKAAWPGVTGEVYAFDAQARVLSEIRHAPAVPANGARRSLREPQAPQPLTELAQAALSSRQAETPDEQRGVVLEPYRNYAGERVIGAWRWLPEYDMGVAAEMSVAEAYAPLRYLDIGIGGVLALMLAVGASWLVPQERLTRWLRGDQYLGAYRLIAKVGEGAISDIYLAEHKLLKRRAAVKIMKPRAATDEAVARFRREVQLASELTHPNTIAIYDYGQAPGGLFYYVMEYLEGWSLAEFVERFGPVPPGRAAYWLRQVCASLAEAHAKGLVHRDIKPQNIVICRTQGQADVAKVLDFGLVKRMDRDETRDLTRPLNLLGTPLYMAPERLHDPASVDVRSDIYAVGAVGYWLLTGRRLYETETDAELVYRVVHVAAPRAGEHSPHAVPPALDELITRCLAKTPAERPASAQEMIAALDAVLADHPWTAADIAAWWREHGHASITRAS